MKSQTFQLQTHNGHLIIPPEIQDYLTHCPDNIKISLTIESPELNNDQLDLSSDDPDRGQTIKDSFRQSLLEIQQKRIAGRPTISEEDVIGYRREIYQEYRRTPRASNRSAITVINQGVSNAPLFVYW